LSDPFSLGDEDFVHSGPRPGGLAARAQAAARGAPAASYLRDCRRLLRRPFLVSSAFRAIIASGQASLLASLIPGRFLFHATRPSGLKSGA